MITNTVTILAITKEQWESVPFTTFVKEALISERRISKNSNLDTERNRYSMYCKQIEDFAKSQFKENKCVQKITLENGYLKEIYEILSNQEITKQYGELISKARIGKSFIPLDYLHNTCESLIELVDKDLPIKPVFLQTKATFLRELMNSNRFFGIVEIISPFSTIEISTYDTQSKTRVEIHKRDPKFSQDASEKDISQSVDDEWHLSNMSHIEITQTLHEFTYADAKKDSSPLRILYSDGSESDPFPRLEKIAVTQKQTAELIRDWPILKASLLSIRHLEQDHLIDMAWFINMEVSKTRFSAETDQFCCEKTIEQLEILEKPLHLHIYETGLQPAIIGFYRGLILWKNNINSVIGDLVVTPYFYDKKRNTYTQGKVWI